MTRITERDLNATLARINRATGNPETVTGYTPGQYIISSAYGGHKLEQVCTTGGGVTSISSGYVSKRELYQFMQAFLAGLATR